MNLRLLAAAAVALLLLPLLAGCMGADQRQPNADVRRQWRAEADAQAPMGYAGTFDVTGQPLAMMGDGLRTSVSAPFTLHVDGLFPSRDPYLYFADAAVTGAGPGLLVVEGADVQVTAGGVGQLAVEHALADGQTVALAAKRGDGVVDKPSANFPDAWSDANQSLFFAQDAPVQVAAWTLSGFSRAVLLSPSGDQDLTAPVSVSASRFFWSSTSRIHASSAALTADAFSVAGNVTDGRIDLEGHDDVLRPLAVFGTGAAITLTPVAARTTASVRVTQVLASHGLVLSAGVELVANDQVVAVERNKAAWSSVSYRETSYRADAVLEEIRITGPGADLLEVPVRKPPYLVEELFSLLEDVAENAPWMVPFFAIPIVLAAPWIAMVDFLLGVVCAFSDCPEKYPYPMWMPAGQVGLFYVKANGAAAPGDYDATLTFVGKNYAPASIDLTVRVVG